MRTRIKQQIPLLKNEKFTNAIRFVMKSIKFNKQATSNVQKKKKSTTLPKKKKPTTLPKPPRSVQPQEIRECDSYLTWFLKELGPLNLNDAIAKGLVNGSICIKLVVKNAIQEGLRELKQAAYDIAHRILDDMVKTGNPAHDAAWKNWKPTTPLEKNPLDILPQEIHVCDAYLVRFLKTLGSLKLNDAIASGQLNGSIRVNVVVKNAIQEGLRELKQAAYDIAHRVLGTIVDTANRIHDEAEKKVRGNNDDQSSSPSSSLV